MPLSYLLTGATGLIGRELVERLLARDGTVHAVVRDPDSAAARALQERGVVVIRGDLAESRLGLGAETVASLRGRVDHFFHAAGLYDITADADSLSRANVDGTRHAIQLAHELAAGCLHHLSSIAVGGDYDGLFTEDMLDEGQELAHPYHRSKFDAEQMVRRTAGAWRIYRPAVVVGDSRTGVIDKADGPYYFFKAIQKARSALPQWFPLLGLELGDTNVVPVDFVADAVDFLAHREGLDGRTFHLVAPRPQPVTDVLNVFARAAHAPQVAMRVDPQFFGRLSLGLAGQLLKLPTLAEIRRQWLQDVGIPDQALAHVAFKPRFDARETMRELSAGSIEPPPLESYAWRLWDFWERHLDPDLARDASLEAAVHGRTVVITGASSGIGQAAAVRIAAAGGVPLLVARSEDRLDAVRAEIEAAGGTAYAYACDLSDGAAIDELVERILGDHLAVDVLVNNAGRSIRRSTALSYDRMHDYERTIALNYLGAVRLTMGLLPHMRTRRSGHVVNVSSVGVQVNPPRFSAYVASKAALDAWTRVVSSETLGDEVTFTTIHMPLVRTPMIAPTRLYESFPTISAQEAAVLICDAIRDRPKQINTRLGTLTEVAYALAPKAVDQILHLAYRVFPDSAAARGTGREDQSASQEALVLARLMRGVYW